MRIRARLCERTIVTVMVKSSIPIVVEHLIRAIILRMKAIRATIPPATPAYETTFVRSRMGAPHADDVTFFVAEQSQSQYS